MSFEYEASDAYYNCKLQSVLRGATRLLLGEKIPQDCLTLATQKAEIKNQLDRMLAPIKL